MMLDMVVTHRVNAGMEKAFEAIARQLTLNTLRSKAVRGTNGSAPMQPKPTS